MGFLKDILVELGILYDASRYAITLPDPVAEPEKLKRKASADISENLVKTAMGAAYETEETTRQIEWDDAYEALKPVHKLTESDIDELGNGGIDLTNDRAVAKAAKLKQMWAMGKSNSQIVEHFSGQRGYGERTIKSFTSAFSRAAVQNGAKTSITN